MPQFIWLRAVLLVEVWYTPEELKKAYRKVSVKHHPDRNPWCDKSEKMMKKITKAYEILNDDEKKAVFAKEEWERRRKAQKEVAKNQKVKKRRKKKK